MQGITLLYIIIAGIAALLLALFQYIYKSKHLSKRELFLTFLRFISVYAILLLLINPKFNSVTYFTEKPKLLLTFDTSESISYLEKKEDVIALQKALQSNVNLNQSFELVSFSFGNDLIASDYLQFSERQTNINKALQRLSNIYQNEVAPIILITDGNQTVGANYQYISNKGELPVYSVIVGDSTKYTDLSISQLNVNRYAFLNNRFPVEVIINYNGTSNVSTEMRIWRGNSIVFNRRISFSAIKSSEIIRTSLLASKVGVQPYRIEIVPLTNEKNKANNIKNFAVEVIDQKTNVAIVSDISHPDLGTLKKSIESNQQRQVTILSPNEYNVKNNDFQLVILYQPNNNFKSTFDKLRQSNQNTLLVTGTITDFNFLNTVQSHFEQSITNQTEDYTARLNTGYSVFLAEDINFQDLPPLKAEFGELKFSVPHEILLYKSINGIETDQSLISTFEVGSLKHALISGEGIWRWRAQTYLDNSNFEGFDEIIGKLVQYLSSTKKRARLNVDHKSFYEGNDNIVIGAQYFNKNFEFDPNANLILKITNNTLNERLEYPLLVNNGFYSVDLSGIKPGNYSFILSHNTEPVSITGSFEVLEFNVEQQFLNPAIDKLNMLSTNTGGKSYYMNQSSNLVNDLLSDSRFKPIQKSSKNVVPLVDWKYLLLIIAISLSAEWLIRKYNGLI